jgi:hypothetical protein
MTRDVLVVDTKPQTGAGIAEWSGMKPGEPIIIVLAIVALCSQLG